MTIPVFLTAKAQEVGKFSEQIEKLQEKLIAYNGENHSASLFLHLDKTTYSPDETLWFKAYLLGDTSLTASVLYVRILDEEKTLVAEEQFPMYDIRSHGSIAFSKPGKAGWINNKYIHNPPKVMLEGNYTLFAYTDRMLELQDTNIFVQHFEIKRLIGRRLAAEASVSDTSQLQAGGQVQVMVKVNERGTPIENINGEYQLLDGDKEIKYAKLKTNSFGEAFINFEYPVKQKNSFIKLKILFTQQADYVELSLKLPHHKPKIPTSETSPLKPYNLKVLHEDGKIKAIAYNLTQQGKCALVLRSKERILWSKELDIPIGDSSIIDVPTANYSKQMMSLAIFREDQVYAQQFFMSKVQDDYKVGITNTLQQNYGKRTKVTVNLRSTDAEGKPVRANFSVSVAEKNRMENSTLITKLIPSKSWQVILAYKKNDFIANAPNTKGVTGKIVHQRYVHGQGISPLLKGRTKQIELSSIQGVILSENKFERIIKKKIIKVSKDDYSFFIPDSLLTTRKGQEWSIRIPKVPKFPFSYEFLVDWESPEIQFDNILLNGQQLQPLEEIKPFVVNQIHKSNPFNFAGTNMLREVAVGKKEKVERRSVRRTNCERYKDMVLGDLPELKDQIYTFGWDEYSEEKIITYLGCGRYKDIKSIRNITIPEDFRHVDHKIDNITEDVRSTLYWEPNVLTDAEGKASFSFYTSDVEGEFDITAQGLDIQSFLPLVGKGSFKVKE